MVHYRKLFLQILHIRMNEVRVTDMELCKFPCLLIKTATGDGNRVFMHTAFYPVIPAAFIAVALYPVAMRIHIMLDMHFPLAHSAIYKPAHDSVFGMLICPRRHLRIQLQLMLYCLKHVITHKSENKSGNLYYFPIIVYRCLSGIFQVS